MGPLAAAGNALGLGAAAQAAEAAPALGSMAQLIQMAPFAFMFAIVYFMLIRPSNQQRDAHRTMLTSLKKDDEVVTTGGVIGRINALDERVVTLEVAQGVRMRIMRERIAGPFSVAGTEAARPMARR